MSSVNQGSRLHREWVDPFTQPIAVLYHSGILRASIILGLWAAPASIAVSELFLSIAALLQLVRLVRGELTLRMTRWSWFGSAWAALLFSLWLLSPEPGLGWSEIRHLLLLSVVCLTLFGFDRPQDLLLAWKGIFVTATISSLVLIGEFFYRLHLYRGEIAAGGDAAFYLRSGGLVHHWMVYASIEVLVVAGLMAYWSAYPSQRRWLWPVISVNALAVLLSLTRMAWLTCTLLVAIHLLWRRSRWIWALPLVLVLLYAVVPDAVRARIADGVDPSYYSNAERVQMIKVGWKMLRDHPWTGVGPGRVDKLYESYLGPGDPVPAYHGHLHNNLAQFAAQFGVVAIVAAVVLIVLMFRELLRARKTALGSDGQFLSDTAVLGLIGFLFAGLFEYTYGHSLALIMIAFAVVPALLDSRRGL